MLQLNTAMEITTCHGLPRLVSDKPSYVRLSWLAAFIFMAVMFFRGFSEFVAKLQSRQVTTSLEADGLNFQFPDVYACYENPVSGSYSANIDASSAAAINAQLNASRDVLRRQIAGLGVTGFAADQMEIGMSLAYPQSISYSLLVDALAHRAEQNVITSDVTYNTDYGMPVFQPIDATVFYHPMFLRCFKWTLNSTWQSKIVQTGSSSGIVATLIVDTNSSEIVSAGAPIHQYVYARGTTIPVSDWSLSVGDFNGPDRQAGVRVFLTPPGEYPSGYVTSFSLGPGRQHTVEIDMNEQVYKANQFDCVNEAPDVQFVNPYDQTPYSHAYSYSYCYYYEYHRQVQALVNMSGIIGPLPWPLRGPKFVMNLTGDPTFLVFYQDPSLEDRSNAFDKQTKAACQSKKPCTTFDYSVSISSADWPTKSSLVPFVSSFIKQAWTSAKAKNLSVPALDFLLTGNASSVASYVRSNLLKVHFKPHRVLCDRVTFSIDYGLSNFISDIGGIMGIYLGMSLLTMCELLELIYDLVAFGRNKVRANATQKVAPKPDTSRLDAPRSDTLSSTSGSQLGTLKIDNLSSASGSQLGAMKIDNLSSVSVRS